MITLERDSFKKRITFQVKGDKYQTMQRRSLFSDRACWCHKLYKQLRDKNNINLVCFNYDLLLL
jgi:hypothetical protein